MYRTGCNQLIHGGYRVACKETDCHFVSCPVRKGRVSILVAFTTPLSDWLSRRACADEIADMASEKIACAAFDLCVEQTGVGPTVTKRHGLLKKETREVPIPYCSVQTQRKGKLREEGAVHYRASDFQIRGIKA